MSHEEYVKYLKNLQRNREEGFDQMCLYAAENRKRFNREHNTPITLKSSDFSVSGCKKLEYGNLEVSTILDLPYKENSKFCIFSE